MPAGPKPGDGLGSSRSEQATMRLCSECSAPFTARNAGHKVCSPKCRVAKSRRKKAGGKVDPKTLERQAALAHKAEMAVEEGAVAIAREIIKEELRPVVREHLAGAVLQAIGDLVELTPLMVAALKDDLTAESPLLDPETGIPLYGPDGRPLINTDHLRRQRAVALVAKYTLGSPGLAPQPENATQPISVSFGALPRPDWDAVQPDRECDVCHESKGPEEFDGLAVRCIDCSATLKHEAQKMLDRGPA